METVDQRIVSQPIHPKVSLKGDGHQNKAPDQQVLRRASLPLSAERINPLQRPEVLQKPLGPSLGPKTDAAIPERQEAMPNTPSLPMTPGLSPTSGLDRNVQIIEQTEIHSERPIAPDMSSRVQLSESPATPEPEVSDSEQEMLLSPGPRGGREPVERSLRMYADEMPPSSLPTAPKAKSDIEVNIGAISLSLDPEPRAPTPAPAPKLATKPRAGGIWSDGRTFARSYVRRA